MLILSSLAQTGLNGYGTCLDYFSEPFASPFVCLCVDSAFLKYLEVDFSLVQVSLYNDYHMALNVCCLQERYTVTF